MKQGQNILEAIKSMALEQEWNSVAELVIQLEKKNGSSVSIIGVSEPSARSFAEWVKQTCTDSVVNQHVFELINSTPAPVIMADKVVAVLQCSVLIDADLLEMLSSIIFSRPLGSYALVFIGSEDFSSEEELETFERGIARLMIEEAENSSDTPDFLKNGIYLWTEAGLPAFLEQRCHHDKAALEQWLVSPSNNSQGIEQFQLLCLLSMAESRAEEYRALINQQSINSGEERLAEVIKQLAECQPRLKKCSDQNFSIIEHQLVSLLSTFEQDINHGAKHYLNEHNKHFSTQLNVKNFEAELTNISEKWLKSTNEIIASGLQTLQKDVEDILLIVDWQIVNEILKNNISSAAYPEVLYKQFEIDYQSINQSLISVDLSELSKTTNDPTFALGIAGASVTAVSLIGLRLVSLSNPLLLAVTSISGALLSGGIGHFRHKNKQRGDWGRLISSKIGQSRQEASVNIAIQFKEESEKFSQMIEETLQEISSLLNNNNMESQHKDRLEASKVEDKIKELRQQVLNLD